MDEKLMESIRKNMKLKSTEELLKIWEENDRIEWTEETFEAIKKILLERGETLPPQKEPGKATVSAGFHIATEDEITRSNAMKKSLRAWGVGLITLGIVHLLAAGFLDPVWGGIIIIIGILNLCIQRRELFIVNGVVLMLAGIMNIIVSLIKGITGWIGIGLLQLAWGANEIIKFSKYTIVKAVVFCPYCGTTNPVNAESCTKCSRTLERIFKESEYECNGCHSDVPEDAKFCPKCGEKLEE